MFQTLRRMIFPIIIIVLVFFVAMIVLEWGLDFSGRGGQMAGGGTYAAKINGENIPLEFYNQIYNNLYQSEAQKTDQELTDDQVAQIRQQAWSELLQDRLLSQEAAKHNIVVTDEDVFQYLASAPPAYVQSMEYFQTNGQFDYQKYMQTMADPQAASFWSQLEPALRNDLTKMKVQQLVIEAASVGEQDIRQAMIDQHEEVEVAAVVVSMMPFVANLPSPPDAELAAYYEAHKSEFEEGEMASLELVYLSKEPSTLDWELSRNKAQVIYDSIVGGADFAEMAQRYSDDPGSAAQGGDIGWFAPGAMVPEFDKAAFEGKEGDLIPPFKTTFGWHIMKHLGFRTEEEADDTGKAKKNVRKAHVVHILIKTTVSQESRDNMHQRLSAILESSKEMSFAEAAKKHDLTTRTTAPFLRNYPIEVLGRSAAASEFAFSNDPGAISAVLETPGLYYVARVASRQPAGIAPLDKVKGRVVNGRNQDIARKIAMDTAAVIARDIAAGIKPEDAASRHRATYEVPPAFSRNGQMGGMIGKDANVIGAAFALTAPGQISKPIEFPAGAVVLILIERRTPSLDQLNQKRDSVKQAVLYAKQSSLYSKWFDRLVKDSEIENYVEQMERAENQPQ